MDITREQDLNIRGFSILLLVVHNYVYRLMGINCNEFAYSKQVTDIFLSHVSSGQMPWYVASFAGWVVVSCFFFLSGYGLTRKYGEAAQLPLYCYIKRHVSKLWKLLLPVFAVYIALFYGAFGHNWNIPSIIAQVTFTINPLCYGDNSFVIEPGIYWFLGAILQFYLFFPVIRRLDKNWLWLLLAAGIAIRYLAIYGMSNDVQEWIRLNALGWVTPFIAGMIAARTPLNLTRRTSVVLCILSAVLLWLCMTHQCLMPLSEICCITCCVTLSRIVTLKPLAWIGGISSSIFMIHPLLRMIFYELGPHSVLLSLACYTVLSIAVGWLYSLLMKAILPEKPKGR